MPRKSKKQIENQPEIVLGFEIGKIYKITKATSVRKEPGFNKSVKLNAILMTDGKRHKLNSNGELDPGTPVLCKEVTEVVGNIWVRCPSGWVIAKCRDEIFLS